MIDFLLILNKLALLDNGAKIEKGLCIAISITGIDRTNKEYDSIGWVGVCYSSENAVEKKPFVLIEGIHEKFKTQQGQGHIGSIITGEDIKLELSIKNKKTVFSKKTMEEIQAKVVDFIASNGIYGKEDFTIKDAK